MTEQMAIDEVKRLRDALQDVRNEITLGGGDFEEPDVDKIFDIANRALTAPQPDTLTSFQRGVRSVYEQANHEGRLEIAEWIASRYASVTLDRKS